MKPVEITRQLYGCPITALALHLDGGIHVSVFGGSRPHIGAVSVAGPAQEEWTAQFPGHKDGVVCERWTKALSAAGFRPAVVEAGIHYDGLSREGIAAVVALTDEMLAELLEKLP